MYLKNYPFLSNLIFSVTSKCNLRCKHCFYWKSLNSNQNGLNLNEIRKISLSLGRMFNLYIAGGEPFLNRNLPEICKILSDQNKICNIHIPTNGTLTKITVESAKRILNKCPNIHLNLGVSLEGLKSTHELIRGPKTFSKAIKTLKKLTKLKKEYKNLKVNAVTTISNKNYDEILNLFKFVREKLNVDYHGYHPLRGNPLDPNLVPLSGMEWQALFKELIKYDKYYFSRMGEKSFRLYAHLCGKKYVYKIMEKGLRRKKWPFKCLAGITNAVLEPDGDVRLCELTQEIGNVRDFNYDLKKVLMSMEAKKLRSKIDHDKLDICFECTHPCFILTSICFGIPYIALNLF